MRKLWTILAIALCLLGASCAKHAEPGRWVHQALEANRLADQAIQRDDRVAAHDILKNLAEDAVPQGVTAADGRAIRQDACFRLALLRLEAGDAKEAKRWARTGLELGMQQDLFTANLLVARGHALQALGDDALAAKDYHAALLINEALMNQALEAPVEGTQP